MDFDHCYNSKTIFEAKFYPLDVLYCCAPSGNRLKANMYPEQDLKSVLKLISDIGTISFKKIILISTVDTQHCSDSSYGGNRLLIEKFVKEMPDHHVVRLCTLIDPDINKNMLYDIKNSQFLDCLNLEQRQHWYLLNDLTRHLEIVVENKIRDINLISEPISAEEIVLRFLSHREFSYRRPCRPYDLKCEQAALMGGKNFYLYDKEQIFEFMNDYIHDNPSQQR